MNDQYPYENRLNENSSHLTPDEYRDKDPYVGEWESTEDTGSYDAYEAKIIAKLPDLGAYKTVEDASSPSVGIAHVSGKRPLDILRVRLSAVSGFVKTSCRKGISNVRSSRALRTVLIVSLVLAMVGGVVVQQKNKKARKRAARAAIAAQKAEASKTETAVKPEIKKVENAAQNVPAKPAPAPAKPAEKVAEPAKKPAVAAAPAKPAEKPAEKPAVAAAPAKPAEKPAEKPAVAAAPAKPAEKPAEKPAVAAAPAKSTEKPAEKPAVAAAPAKPAEKPAEKPAVAAAPAKPAEKPAEKPAVAAAPVKPAEKPAEKPAVAATASTTNATKLTEPTSPWDRPATDGYTPWSMNSVNRTEAAATMAQAPAMNGDAGFSTTTSSRASASTPMASQGTVPQHYVPTYARNSVPTTTQGPVQGNFTPQQYAQQPYGQQYVAPQGVPVAQPVLPNAHYGNQYPPTVPNAYVQPQHYPQNYPAAQGQVPTNAATSTYYQTPRPPAIPMAQAPTYSGNPQYPAQYPDPAQYPAQYANQYPPVQPQQPIQQSVPQQGTYQQAVPVHQSYNTVPAQARQAPQNGTVYSGGNAYQQQQGTLYPQGAVYQQGTVPQGYYR